MARFYSKGDCNSHQTKAEKKKVCENWCVYNSSFSPPILLTSFVCTAMRNVQGRTGNGTRVRLNARTTGAVHSHFQYDIPAPLPPYERPDSTGCVLLLLVSFALVVSMQSTCTHCGCCTYLYHTCAMCRGRPPYALMPPYAIPTYALALPCWVISLRTCIYCYPSCTSYLASVAETVISRVFVVR